MERLMVAVPELIVENLFDNILEKMDEEKRESNENDANEIDAFEKQKVPS